MQFLFGTDGSLKWRDSANGVEKFFVTGVNGVNADINGNVDLIPAGTMQMFAGNTIPAGWLLCDGSAISRTNYAKLFSAIGTIYGKGNGSTTFALPNLIDRVVQGAAAAGTYKEAGLPNITGGMSSPDSRYSAVCGYADTFTGAFKNTKRQGIGATFNANSGHALNFDASNSNPIYGNSTTVQPPALTMLPIIKY